MARTGIDGLPSRYGLGSLVPALLQDDDFAMRWLAGLDEVLAPVQSTLDNLDAYLDPLLAPLDFVEWLAGWVGASTDEDMDSLDTRALVANMAMLYGMRGTLQGMLHYLDLAAPARIVSVDDGCGVSWSADPTTEIDGAGTTPVLVVRVRGSADDVAETERMVHAWCPAHIGYRVEVAR